MPSDRKPSLILPVAGAILLLLAIYIGAYYSLAKPQLRVYYDGHDYTRVLSPRFTGASHLDFYLARFFAPVHWLDRRIRPHVWEPTP